MERSLLEQVIAEQYSVIPDALITRYFAHDLKQVQQSSLIVIITGVRRCGKSTWLQYCRSKAMEKDYYLSFDDERLINFTVEDFQLLLELFVEHYGQQKTCYFDEIQNIPGWERFIRRLHDQGYKIYITGSNAQMLSQELGTHLTGRYVQLEMFPFSFKEFMEYHRYPLPKAVAATSTKAMLNRYLKTYLEKGGFPEFLSSGLPLYLQGLYESVLYRDILARYRLTSDRLLRQLGVYLASNVGKEISFNSLRKLLNLGSTNTVIDYCHYLQNSYLYFFVNRFDYSLKAQSVSPKKVYAIDAALAHTIGFRQSGDLGRFMENAVFLELRRRGYQIYYHRGQKECDFVACQYNRIELLIQVCYELKTPETEQREIDGLLDALACYGLSHGLILTFSETGCKKITREGIEYEITIAPLSRWLLSAAEMID